MIEYQCIYTPFGDCVIAEKFSGRQNDGVGKIIFLEFIEKGGLQPVVNNLQQLYPSCQLVDISDKSHYPDKHRIVFEELMDVNKIGWDRLELKGTPFQLAVWQTLFGVSFGEIISYSQLAVRAGYPKAVRAVATVVASNPISLIIPCHRIVRNEALGGNTQQRDLQKLKKYGNYRWGWEVKSKLIEWERGCGK